MKIFPAIDIKDKKCVRLVKGDFDNKTVYEMSPVEQAEKYKDHGFKNLHIVDLDGALTGETVNLDIIQEIVTKFDLKIEIGGGIRNLESIQKYTDAGVEKVILGSAAIKDKNFLKEACEKFPNKIALGLDAKDGYLSVSGWKENSNLKTLDYLKKVTDVLNKVFIAVIIISTVTVIIGLVVISSAIIVQGKIKTFQNLVFKILGFSKKEIIYSSLIEFIITFFSIILFSTIFSIISSKFIIENIFQLKWLFEFDIFLNVTITVGLVTMILIVFTNLKYLSPKVYPLVRNE